jgi:hypothetical protein
MDCLAVALLAVGATAATLRPLPSNNHPNASVGTMSLSELKTDVNKLATGDYDDQSFVYSAKRISRVPPQPAPAACHGKYARRDPVHSAMLRLGP